MTELVRRQKSFGLMTYQTSLLDLSARAPASPSESVKLACPSLARSTLRTRPSLIDTDTILLSGGRNDCLTLFEESALSQLSGKGSGADAPNATSKPTLIAIILILIWACPPNEGPQTCRSAPASNPISCVPRK